MEAIKVASIRRSLQYGNEHFTEAFFEKFIVSPGVDIGYMGAGMFPPMWSLSGVDRDIFPDNTVLPFPDSSQLTVHASHVLEHCEDPLGTIREWFRVLKPDGHLIITVPHKFLFEKKMLPPSNFDSDHKRFYTPAKLLGELEISLTPNHWRLVYIRDNDWEFDYTRGPETHSSGCYEIECVIKKIQPPNWEIK